MRTDSNTALSPILNTPSKKSAQVKSSAENGSAFANDLNKSIQVLADKNNASKTTGSSSSSTVNVPISADSSSQSSISMKENGDQVSLPVTSEQVEAATLLEENTNALKETSGKTLHSNGDSLPINADVSKKMTLDDVVSGDLVKATPVSQSPVTAASLTQDAENTSDNLPLANGAIVKTEVSSNAENAELKGPVTAVSLTQDAENTSDNLPLANGAIVKTEVSSNAESAELKGPVTAVSLTQGAENTSDNLPLANGAVVKAEVSSSAESAESDISDADGSKLVVLDKDVPLIDPKGVSQVTTELGITYSEDVNHESVDELNWVLAQMGMSKTRVASPSEATAVQAQVVSKPMASTNYNARLQTPSLSLLNDSLVQNDSLAGAITDVVLEEGVVIDQPVELRKKEQEAMLTRMMPALNADDSQESRLSDLNAMIQNGNRLPPSSLTANVLPQAAAPNLAMSVPPGHPGWAGEMAQKVSWVARDGGHTAHIRLDPPELGSLTVKVSVDSDSNTQISFVAATPQARDMLESQMGRLREMLAQQGMDLSRADVDVSQQDASGAEQRESSRGGRPVALNDEGDDTELFSNKTSYVSSSGVDYYA